jgi:hypothetical protein
LDDRRESFKKDNPPAIKGTGYVVDSLEAALLEFDRNSSFEEGFLAAVSILVMTLTRRAASMGTWPGHSMAKRGFRKVGSPKLLCGV